MPQYDEFKHSKHIFYFGYLAASRAVDYLEPGIAFWTPYDSITFNKLPLSQRFFYIITSDMKFNRYPHLLITPGFNGTADPDFEKLRITSDTNRIVGYPMEEGKPLSDYLQETYHKVEALVSNYLEETEKEKKPMQGLSRPPALQCQLLNDFSLTTKEATNNSSSKGGVSFQEYQEINKKIHNETKQDPSIGILGFLKEKNKPKTHKEYIQQLMIRYENSGFGSYKAARKVKVNFFKYPPGKVKKSKTRYETSISYGTNPLRKKISSK